MFFQSEFKLFVQMPIEQIIAEIKNNNYYEVKVNKQVYKYYMRNVIKEYYII